jgi:hypothetical protein
MIGTVARLDAAARVAVTTAQVVRARKGVERTDRRVLRDAFTGERIVRVVGRRNDPVRGTCGGRSEPGEQDGTKNLSFHGEEACLKRRDRKFRNSATSPP